MRNYSEIGCLTLLGVTLTVYVAAGNCQPDQMPCDWSSKNINAEEVEKAVKQGSGKHYFVKVSTQSVSQKGIKNSLAGFPALSFPGISEIVNEPVLSVNSAFLALPELLSPAVDVNFPGTNLKYCEVLDFKNPASFLHLEIRAGPFKA